MVQYFRLCLHLLGWLSCHFVLCTPKSLLWTLRNKDINMWIFFKQLHTRKWEFSSLQGLIIMLPSFRILPLTLIASYFMLKWKSYQCMTAAATGSRGEIALGHVTCSLLYTELSFFLCDIFLEFMTPHTDGQWFLKTSSFEWIPDDSGQL